MAHSNTMPGNQPDFKKLYRLFQEGNKPVSIILNHGFHPDVVEKEYDRYRKFRTMSRRVDSHIMLDILPRYKDKTVWLPILQSFKKHGYLIKAEVMQLVRELLTEMSKDDFEGGWDWRIIKCGKCSYISDRVLVDPAGRIKMNGYTTVNIDGCRWCMK
jgi:hypothetical protein